MTRNAPKTRYSDTQTVFNQLMKPAYTAIAVLLLTGAAAPMTGKSGTASPGRQGPAATPATGAAPAAPAASGGTYTFWRTGVISPYYGRVPEMDPKRKISEQDCTRPIVLDGGNLKCK